jgi:hypothetical protein
VGRLVASPDAGVLIWIAALVAVTSVGYLLGVGGRWTALTGMGLALAALALAVFEGVAAFPRVLSVATLPLGMTSLPVSYGLEPGYCLFLGGAVLAVVAGTLMMVARPGIASAAARPLAWAARPSTPPDRHPPTATQEWRRPPRPRPDPLPHPYTR